jgi:hypothetical protein
VNRQELLSFVLASQAPSGAFPSLVGLPVGRIRDDNGFVTALVLSELEALSGDAAVATALGRGLDFLARCEAPSRPGAFSFYPLDAHPRWIGVLLAPDADDTALFSLALQQGGRRPPAFLAHVADQVLAPHRLLDGSARAEPWHRPGAQLTWLTGQTPRNAPNTIDCCVNVNVLALLWHAGPPFTARAAALVDMVAHALEWAGDSQERARRIVPYYPHPIELLHAVRRAVRGGVRDLEPHLARIAEAPWARIDHDELFPDGRPICSSIDGRVVWTSPVLQAARRLSALG